MIYGKNETMTLVAGADLSGQQFKFVGGTGVLATSETNPVGILDNKPQAGEGATVIIRGGGKLYRGGSLVAGALVGQSNTASGAGTLVLSGFHHVGFCVVAATSGQLASVQLTNLPAYLAK